MEFWDRYLFRGYIAAALARGTFVAFILPLLSLLLLQEPLMKERSHAFMMAWYMPCPVITMPATTGLSARTFPGLVHP
jgi:hypothetical protein